MKREWCTTDMMNSDMRHGCVMENDDKKREITVDKRTLTVVAKTLRVE